MAAVTVQVADHVATIAFDLPGGRFDRDALDELATAARQVGDDTENIYAAVITSSGSGFAAGWTEAALGEPVITGLTPLGAAFDAVAAIPQPVIAAVSGAVESAGFELALACDIRLAGESARFAMPETELGMVPRGGGTQRLPRAIGRSHALRLLLTGEAIDAVEALRIGLVSSVVSDAALTVAAATVARTIASRGPIATRLAKEAVQRGSELPLAQGLQTELDLTVILQTTEDRAEGVQAFVEKRPPEFNNR
jgi:enoyl-CoA hydratase/carnithine racemase